MASRFNKTDRLTLTDLWRLQVVTHRPETQIKMGEGVRRGSCHGHVTGRGRGRAVRIKAIGFYRCVCPLFRKGENF